MRGFFVFFPLLGFVAAQMHNQHQNMGGMGAQGGGYGGMGAQGGGYDPFFNDFGKGTGSRTPPPWANPPGQAAPIGNSGVFGQSQSSTKPPEHNPIPVGDPQVQNNNPYANADPNANTGNSGELAGFGQADVFHAHLDGNGGAAGGAQPLPGPGSFGGAGGGTGRSSGIENRMVDYNMYDLANDNEETVVQEAAEGEAGIQIGMRPDPDAADVGPNSAERINPDYFGDGAGLQGGGYRGPLLPNGRNGPPVNSPDIPAAVGGVRGGGGSGGRKVDGKGGGDFKNLEGDGKTGSKGVSVGTAVGASFGVVIVGLVAGAVVLYVRKKRKQIGYNSPI